MWPYASILHASILQRKIKAMAIVLRYQYLITKAEIKTALNKKPDVATGFLSICCFFMLERKFATTDVLGKFLIILSFVPLPIPFAVRRIRD